MKRFLTLFLALACILGMALPALASQGAPALDEEACAKLLEIIAKDEIEDQLYAYCRSMDRIDHALGYSVFAKESQVNYNTYYIGDGAGFIDWVCDYHSQYILWTSHRVSNMSIEVDGNKACSETYVTVALRMMSPSGQLQEQTGCGRYIDQWVYEDGAWRISVRSYVQDFADIRDVTEDSGQWGGTRDNTDPSYGVLAMGQ